MRQNRREDNVCLQACKHGLPQSRPWLDLWTDQRGLWAIIPECGFFRGQCRL